MTARMTNTTIGRRRLLASASAVLILNAFLSSTVSAQLFGGGGGGIGRVVAVLQEILKNAEQQLGSLQNILEGADLSGVGDVAAELRQVRNLFGQIQAIGYELETVAAEFDRLFPERFEDLTLTEALGVTERLGTNLRNTIRHALQVQADVIESQLSTTARTDILTTAAAAGGPTAALQSIAQLQAVQIQQMSRLQGLLAAQSRLFATELAEIQTIQTRAAKIRADYRSAELIERDPAPILLER